MFRKLAVALLVMAFSLPLVAQEDLQSLRLKAEQGNAEAQVDLGRMYGTGKGVPQNYSEAYKWIRLAAEQGSAEAQATLGGVIYLEGLGVPQNYSEAYKWIRLAAEQGYVNSQFGLGEMFANGQGVPQNYQKAYVWYSISVAQGRANAELREEAVSKRDKVAANLTPEDLSKAQALASRCFESNFKDCD